MHTFKIGNIEAGGGKLFLMAGPCVLEGFERSLKIGRRAKEIAENLNLPYIFKASFDKANRSSIKSFRGPGLDEGLKILAAIKAELGVPVVTDIHETYQAEPVAQVADIIQIPAFLCRQTDLLAAAAKTGKVVNVKKGQFLSPNDMKNVVVKLEETGAEKIMLTERGASFGYNNLVVDMRGLPIMRGFGYPVIFDGTHSVQLPGGAGTSSAGQREFVGYLTRAAAAVGIDGLFLEVHDNPAEALSDGANMIYLDKLENLLKNVLAVHEAAKNLCEV
ncbi:MAG: 3-deoxy-8-phosphooctulonate synthase [Selenomonadaceae bacterium]|nr:3-deoxy-8-phosphooctulonate synthase [Selenomonadaceae bacterium]